MHARLTKGSAVLVASDTMPGRLLQQGSNFSVNIQCESLEAIDNFFDDLNEQSKVTIPLAAHVLGARFGMLTDQFGVNWMFNLDKPQK
jgi:PhnB protein